MTRLVAGLLVVQRTIALVVGMSVTRIVEMVKGVDGGGGGDGGGELIFKGIE